MLVFYSSTITMMHGPINIRLPNECSRENYTQLTNLCNVKVKQRIGADHFGYVNIFINEPIKIMA